MSTSSSGKRPPSGRGPSDRGQTTIDFAIGISIFLAVLLFIFLFLPGILSPFTTSAQQETVSSNRVADQLATGTLADPSEPYVLDSQCTVQFFQNDPSGCRFEGGDVEERVGVPDRSVNVTIRGNVSSTGDGNDILCWDNSGDRTGLVETSNSDCDVTLTDGDSSPPNRRSVTSLRVVALDGTDATLYVEMW